jgi:hypothetical protein
MQTICALSSVTRYLASQRSITSERASASILGRARPSGPNLTLDAQPYFASKARVRLDATVCAIHRPRPEAPRSGLEGRSSSLGRFRNQQPPPPRLANCDSRS